MRYSLGRHGKIAIAVWCTGLLTSAVAGLVIDGRNQALLKDQFERLTEESSSIVLERFQLYQYGLRGAHGAIAAVGVDKITRQRFEAYVATRDFPHEFPGARGFGFIVRVAPEDTTAFVASARADGAPDFSVRELSGNNGDRFVIKYIYPTDANQTATGLDIASEPNRREAALAALRSGLPQLTAPITLVQASGKKNQGFLLLSPVYRGPRVPETAEARDSEAIGWVYAPLVAEEVLANAGVRGSQIHLTLTDLLEPTPFYVSGNSSMPETQHADLQEERRIEIFGRVWELKARATPDFFAATPVTNPLAVALTLLILSTALSAALYAVLHAKQRRSDLELEQNRLAASVVDAAPHGLIVVDDTGRVFRANVVAAETFGYPIDRLVGMTLEELLPADRRARHVELRATYDHTRRDMSATRNVRGLRSDGTEFHISVKLSPVRLGGRRYVVAGVSDISEQISARELLAESKERWQQLANSLPQLVWTSDSESNCDFLSQRWQEYTGLNADTHVGEEWLSCVHPDDLDAVRTAWNQARSGAGSLSTECRIRSHDGEYRWFDMRAVPLLGEDGRIERWIGSWTDIQERRWAEERVLQLLETTAARADLRTSELEDVRRDLQTIVDAIPSMIGYWDSDLVNQFANKAYQEWFGSPSEGLKGKHMRDLLRVELFEKNRPFLEAALRGEPQRFERELVDVHGETRHAQAHYLPDIRDGKVHGFYVLMFDVTELKNSARSLALAKDKAEAATRAKSVFLTSMSHELRTPMNSVVGFSDLMLSGNFGPLNEKQTEFMRIVQKCAKHLLNLMNEVLELSRIDSGRMSISIETVHISPIVKSTIATLAPLASSKGIRIEAKDIGTTTLAARADATRLQQTLINLCSNAIKYNMPGGRVDIRCQELGDRLRIRIEDTGIGIPINRQAELFQPFNRLGAEQGSIEGSGIGLALTKGLVETMNGTIGFTSAEGKGSTFWVELPLDKSQGADSDGSIYAGTALTLPAASGPIKVVYIEDNEQNRVLFRNYMSLIPELELIEAGDGELGLEVVRAQRPHIVFLDINLPKLDGYQFLKQLRADPQFEDIKVVALTANAMSGDKERGLAAGFDRYLTKPVALNEVVDAIASLALTGSASQRGSKVA